MENSSTWIPALSASGLLTAISFLASRLASSRISESIKHEYDKKIETIRAGTIEKIEALKAEIAQKDAINSSFRESLLSASSWRKQEIEKRRIDAIGDLWAAYLSLNTLRFNTDMMGRIDFKAACEMMPNQGIQRTVEAFGSKVDLSKIPYEVAAKTRLFISDWAWAVYNAILSIHADALVRMTLLRCQSGDHKLLKHDVTDNLIKAVLPEKSTIIDQFSYNCHSFLLDDLENLLLKELRNNLEGMEYRFKTAEEHEEIMKLISKKMQKQNPEAASETFPNNAVQC